MLSFGSGILVGGLGVCGVIIIYICIGAFIEGVKEKKYQAFLSIKGDILAQARADSRENQRVLFQVLEGVEERICVRLKKAEDNFTAYIKSIRKKKK